MLDFTSALYLGLRHPSASLRPWTEFTTGVPAALRPPPGATEVARTLAALKGCERATLGPSTLHLFWDLFTILSGTRAAILMDAGLYPIARWGIERAASRGVPVGRFPHHGAAALQRRVAFYARRGLRPVVATDGFCPNCGRPAPLGDYLEIVRAFDGRLVIDDSQALGILGHGPGPGTPYGRGGGGSLNWHGIEGPEMVVVSSLAKGFGVPVAVLAGSRTTVRRFETKSDTRIHTSPPSMAALHAAERALAVNRERGDFLRFRLAQLVRHFRHRLAEVGFSARGGLFPVQNMTLPSGIDAPTLHARLLRFGVRAVLRRDAISGGAILSFLITARHRPEDVNRAAVALVEAAGELRSRRAQGR